MRRTLLPWTAALALAISCGADLEPPSTLDLTVEGLGGEAALRSMSTVRFDVDGERSFSNEGVTPGVMLDLASYTATYIYDFDSGDLRFDMDKQVHFEALASFPPASFTVTVNGDVGSLDQQAGFLPPGPLPSQTVGALSQQFRLFNPHVYVREAMLGELAMTEQASETLDGVEYRVLGFDTGVAAAELFVDAQTGQIAQLKTLENNQLNRDVEVVVRYGDWSEQAGVSFPGSVDVRVDGNTVHTQTRTAHAVNPTLAEGTFALATEAAGTVADPEAHEWGTHTHNGIDEFFQLTFPYVLSPPNTVQELAPGVVFLANTWTSMGVRIDDTIVVLEAPLSPAWGETIMRELGEAQPGAALGYIVPTHFHQDHAAGVRSFVAAGATLVVPEGIESFWERTLAAPSTVYPDLLETTAGVEPTIATFSDQSPWVLEDDQTRLTVHHIPDNPHSEDLTLSVIDTADQRFVYISDLYNAGFGMTLVLGGPEAFYANMRSLGLIDADCVAPVPTTIVPGHGVPLTLDASLAELAEQGIDVGCP